MNFLDHKTTLQVTEITERLVNTILVDQIYLSQYEHEGICQQELTILLLHTNKQFLVEAKPMVGMVMEAHSRFRYRIYYVHEVWQCVRNGSIPFLYRCQPENLLYINPESDFIIPIDMISLGSAVEKARLAIRLEEKKIAGFREGVELYLEKGNCQLCAFMLHQVFELSYRMTQIAIFGKEKISHSIRKHHWLMLPYMPSLKSVFDRNNEQDMDIMELLDEAYLAVRYDNNYHIAERQLTYLVHKSYRMQSMATQACNDILEEFGHALNAAET